MGTLQGLEETYGAQGFRVLGFYSNDFNQAGSPSDIEACSETYGVTFPQFAIDHVCSAPTTSCQNPNAADIQPVWQWLSSPASSRPRGIFTSTSSRATAS